MSRRPHRWTGMRRMRVLRSTETVYGAITRLLHWTVALLVLGLIWLGWWT